ncbi:hypothetical protein HPP92_011976 [Vanilla planifolia]|uniref:Uncharacterized protein n=1 Tax=Vanilla planifolia TaxID=51239 RepID=A0A835V3B3_VANPL|nr:hypothetical protein HPP92_011976 [Vanilla planifolia]
MDQGLQCSPLVRNLAHKAFDLLTRTLLRLYSISSDPHPLFSALTAVGVVAILYLPRNLFPILFSPVLLSTLLLLATLLHFGAPPPTETRPRSLPNLRSDDTETFILSFSTKQPPIRDYLLQWGNRGGPLEVIYEEYEGEEEEEEEVEEGEEDGYFQECPKRRERGFDGHSFSDSDSGSEESSLAVGCESPVSLCFRWYEEGDDLIEIAVEDDNIFEIDISACG